MWVIWSRWFIIYQSSVGFAQVSLSPWRCLSILLRPWMFLWGTDREPRKRKLKCTGPLGALAFNWHPITFASFHWPHQVCMANPKSRGKRCRCRLEWRIKTIMQVTTYGIRPNQERTMKKYKAGWWLKQIKDATFGSQVYVMVYCHNLGCL